ncbi:MAG: hypothetical protein LBM19_03055 [Holosporales bacterium]|jgi:hypothetical protein|nr:hypothetical protein [Holosporales bacterium]
MKNTGIIFYGADREATLNQAYELAVNHMAKGSNIDKDTIAKYVSSNAYPNFLCVKKPEDKNEISIEESRNIIEFLSQTKSVPGNRAVVIENSEDMSKNAANSILKILEEPPEDAVLILTTSKLFSILPTIRSRCLKMAAESDFLLSSDVCDPKTYVKLALKDVNCDFIEKTISFIESGCKNFVEFGKQNAENMADFVKIAIAYCSFLCFKTRDQNFARLVLNLHKFSNLVRRTYPDKQSVIVAIGGVLNQGLFLSL